MVASQTAASMFLFFFLILILLIRQPKMLTVIVVPTLEEVFCFSTPPLFLLLLLLLFLSCQCQSTAHTRRGGQGRARGLWKRWRASRLQFHHQLRFMSVVDGCSGHAGGEVHSGDSTWQVDCANPGGLLDA